MRSIKMDSKKTIIIFGESGSGKTSVIKMLGGENVAGVPDVSSSCSLKTEIFEYGNTMFYETRGTEEVSNVIQTLESLINLLKTLKDGVNLLIFVVQKGRIKKSNEDYYELFVNTIFMKKVPAILLLTYSEIEKDPESWWSNNQKNFDSYGMTFKDVILGCATKGEGMHQSLRPMFEKEFEKTKQKLQDSIEKNALHTPWEISSWSEWFCNIFQTVWILLGRSLKWSKMPQRSEVIQFLTKMEFDKETVSTMAKELVYEVEREVMANNWWNPWYLFDWCLRWLRS